MFPVRTEWSSRWASRLVFPASASGVWNVSILAQKSISVQLSDKSHRAKARRRCCFGGKTRPLISPRLEMQMRSNEGRGKRNTWNWGKCRQKTGGTCKSAAPFNKKATHLQYIKHLISGHHVYSSPKVRATCGRLLSLHRSMRQQLWHTQDNMGGGRMHFSRFLNRCKLGRRVLTEFWARRLSADPDSTRDNLFNSHSFV